MPFPASPLSNTDLIRAFDPGSADRPKGIQQHGRHGALPWLLDSAPQCTLAREMLAGYPLTRTELIRARSQPTDKGSV